MTHYSVYSCCKFLLYYVRIIHQPVILPAPCTYIIVLHIEQLCKACLCQAYAEELHERVRKDYWGYSPEECLQSAELHKIHYQVSVL